MDCGYRPSCLVIADDLTGACDAGVPFARRGLTCDVVFSVEAARESAAEVVVLSTDSRGDTETAAAQKVSACGCLRPDGARPLLFKKIDSTLRGPIAAEIDAALRVFDVRCAIIAPAFPKMGRTIRGGVLTVWDAAHVSKLEVCPRLDAMKPWLMPPPATFASSEAMADRVKALVRAGVRSLVFDSESEADLRRIAAMLPLLPVALWVGSGGLAGELAALVDVPRRDPDPWSPRPGEAVYCVGSTHAVTRRQVRELVRQQNVCELRAECAPGERARNALAAGEPVLLHVERGIATESMLTDFAEAVRSAPLSGIVVAGGDTAAQLCRALRVPAISLRGEAGEGLPWGIFAGGLLEGLPLITKSGGFGADGALVRAGTFLSSGRAKYCEDHRMDTIGQGRPSIAISIGDPAGVGAEIVVKALADPETAALAEWVVVGDESVLTQVSHRCGIPFVTGETVRIASCSALDPSHEIRYGELREDYGRAAVSYVRDATEMCLRGETAAIVTAPLNKEAVTLSGMPFSGHTEYIAALCGATESRMMLAGERLKVVHVTTHVPLRQACEATVQRILRTIELGYKAMRMMGYSEPRIAVAGLNPHAGEHGLFGTEDAERIVPAVEAARKIGIDCQGPVPPDTVFLKAYRGAYDLVVAMYHDQGHIPMKLVAFETTVNVSLGIPIIRTSVDHGTAFDIAGRNQADPTNMKAAMRMAAAMARNRLAGAGKR